VGFPAYSATTVGSMVLEARKPWCWEVEESRNSSDPQLGLLRDNDPVCPAFFTAVCAPKEMPLGWDSY
jgi:hypothetical protein